MAEPEPWRKTGRKAGEEHWLGLTPSAVVEVSLYDDAGRQQGRGVVKLQHRAIEDEAGKGQTWRGFFLAIEDGYYEWWGTKSLPHEGAAIPLLSGGGPSVWGANAVPGPHPR